VVKPRRARAKKGGESALALAAATDAPQMLAAAPVIEAAATAEAPAAPAIKPRKSRAPKAAAAPAAEALESAPSTPARRAGRKTSAKGTDRG
jgi:ribonuclease R